MTRSKRTHKCGRGNIGSNGSYIARTAANSGIDQRGGNDNLFAAATVLGCCARKEFEV